MFGQEFADRHLAYTNAKRIQVNRQMMDVYAKKKQKPLELPELKYDQNSQDVRSLTGMPIIARINNTKHELCNNELSLLNISIGSTIQSPLQMVEIR